MAVHHTSRRHEVDDVWQDAVLIHDDTVQVFLLIHSAVKR